MGCFLGCFGGEKDAKRRKRRVSRGSPQRQLQRNRIQNAHQENVVTTEQSIKETNSVNLDSQLRSKLEEVEQLSLSPKEESALNSNITTQEHVSGHQTTDFQPESAISTDKETKHALKTSSPPHLASGDDGFVTTSAGSYASNLKNKSKGTEQLSPSPKKRVTFNSNVTTYEHISVEDSIDFQEDLKTPSQSYSVSDEGSVTSSVGSYPPNHRYHNARESDDEAEYGDSDLDDMDDDDDEDYYDNDYDEDDIDVRNIGQKVWYESVTASMESRTGNPSPQGINEEVDSPMVEPQPFNNDLEAFTSRTYARDRSNYVNSVLNPVGNTSQWKAAKSRGQQQHLKKPPSQKENLVDNFEASEPPTFGRTKSNRLKNSNQEIAVDASLSTWLSSPEATPSKKTMPGEHASVKSFEDRPILGAWTVDELRQVSNSASPRKSPSRSPDETPIIGTVGTYWNHLGSAPAAKQSDSSFKGIPNTTSKYREDKRVNWHSTPFEKRIDRAISQGAAEA